MQKALNEYSITDLMKKLLTMAIHHPPFLRGNTDFDFKIRVVFSPTVILGQLVIISWHREQRHICFFAHCYFHCCLFLPRFALILILILPTKPAG